MSGTQSPFNLPEKKEEKQITVSLGAKDGTLASLLPKKTQENLSIEQKNSIDSYMGNMRYGIAAIAPIICKSDQCPYYLKCPLVRAKIELPVGKDCPVEQALQKLWFDQFLEASGIRIEDLQTSAYDLLLLNDLANYQLLEARAAMELADNPKIQLKTVAAFDPEGNPVFTFTLNNLIHFKEKISKMKMKILNEMIATRKVQSEDSSRKSNDRSMIMAEKIKKMKADMGKDAPKVLDADFEVKDENKPDI